jgi:ribosomal protein S18 acetylase RimI-like enzyme
MWHTPGSLRPTGPPLMHELDNVVWHALCGTHSWAAERAAGARRYVPDISVFAAIDDFESASWTSLHELVGPDGLAVLARPNIPEPPPGWTTLLRVAAYQMVLDGALPPAPDTEFATRALIAADVPSMLDLVERTQPGPFRPRTIELGGYVGAFDGDRLVSMAGHRITTTTHTEVSAVCTDADYRKRGLGATLTIAVAQALLAHGSTPMLHVAADNPARNLYESLGFTVRTSIDIVGVRADTVR